MSGSASMKTATVQLAASISRLHIVAIAMMGTFTFGWLFTGRYLWLLMVICGLDWFVVNLLNRVVDLKEDEANEIRGTDFTARHRRTLVITGFSLLGASLVLVHLIEPAITPLRITGHLLGLAYNYPLLPGGRRIKQLYLLKNVASATGFMVTVFGYPLAVAGWPWLSGAAASLPAGITPATIVWAALFFFPFEISYEVIYDLRDAPGDRAAGMKTFPVVHGDRVAARIIDTLLVVSVASLVVGYATGAVPWRLFIMFAAPVLQLVLYKRAFRRGITAGDCIGLTWLGVALLISYHLWIIAGLPGSEVPV